MSKMKNKRFLAAILTMVLCLTLTVPAPLFAADDDGNGNGNGNEVEVGTRPYVEGEVIVCYIDPEDVDQQALDEEIKNPGSTDDVADDNAKGTSSIEIKPTDAEIKENLNLLDMVEQSDSLMELGDKPIKKMKGVKKGIIKKNKAYKGKAKANIGLIKSKSKKYDTEELAEKISELPNVDYAQPNYIYETMAATPTWNNQWAYDSKNYSGKTKSDYHMNIPSWNISTNKNAEGTVVAVLDTGVDYNHIDLKDVMWDDGDTIEALTAMGGGKYGYNAYNATKSASSKDPMDIGSHGTHCAGIIGAAWNGTDSVSGAANGVEIMAIRAAIDEESLSDAALISGMTYIKTAKDNGVNVVAVNNSWGSSVPYGDDKRDTALENAITNLGESGVMCVFAAGNEEGDCDVLYNEENPYYYDDYNGKKQGPFYGRWQSFYYHSLKNTLIVGGNGPTGKPAWYTNYGATTVDIFAPGGDYYEGYNYTGEILSTLPRDISGKDRYGYMEGTSMACPAAVGAVAILAAHNPDASMEDIKSALIDSAKQDSRVSGKCIANGYIDVAAALVSFEHNWSSTWTGNEKCHWRECTDVGCKARTDIEEHTYTGSVSQGYIGCATCNFYKYYYQTLERSDVVDASVQNELRSTLSGTLTSDEIKVQCFNIALKTSAPTCGSGMKIVIPYTWISDLPNDVTMEQLEHYTFAIAHQTESAVIESLDYVVTPEGLEVSVSQLGNFAVGFVKEMTSQGDLDGDYRLTITDVQLLCRGLADNTLIDELRSIADMNGDNKIDVNDAIMLRNKVA